MDVGSAHARKYGRSSLACRKRKVRCDTRKPECSQCLKSSERCSYKYDARNGQLATQLQHAEEQVHQLRNSIRELSRKSEAEASSKEGWTPTSARTTDLSIDESGIVNYYGATSRFHHRAYTDVASEAQEAEQQYHRRWLKSNARFQSSWEARAYERLGTDLAQLDIDAASAKLLIHIYWVWQAPLHNCVYRRCFFRDMAMGGPYFSPFLLNVIFAHACRHTKKDDPAFSTFDKGEFFLRRAKTLLVDELETPKIPTIQGLLILGGRQCAIGKNSEGWLYTSMAIGMVKDMGLHLPNSAGQRMKELEPDDLEARTRLYLSTYAWDKSISLCLGRPPQLREMPYSSNCLLDDADDLQEWRPVYLSASEHLYPQPTVSYTTLTFSAFCQLARLVDRLYAEVYSRASESMQVRSVYAFEQEIRQLYHSLPAHLHFDHTAPDAYSPPPHILCLNVLYHTMLILLYRPFCQPKHSIYTDEDLVDHARKVCCEEAALVNAHFQAYGKAFDYRNQTYLLSYCVYTAATIEVQLLRDHDTHVASAAAERLATTLSMLEAEAEQTPGIRKSVDIIRSQIYSTPKHRTGTEHGQSQLSSLMSNEDVLGTEAGGMGNPLSVSFHGSHTGAYEKGPVDDNQQTLDLSGLDEAGEMPWFDWNASDISGGFPLYDESTWPIHVPIWHPTG